ncbi:hypothetical protein [Sphingobacterium bambusae]|uniref:Antirestriction protein n=1 Tax=Sphingobacterium bambusae TaxID=662858 RepID=A0ABW6BH41_9SPHI|nr:hypothetical protein [Sphingobacterium bambusae]WPL49592.1 hypothetical protein SCB77_03890 [Sphingobacterium bambusae]
MMEKYLNEEQIRSRLGAGRSVEQWLGFVEKDDFTILKWLSIDCVKNEGVAVVYQECVDEGGEEFLDIYEFSPIDPDEPFGVISTFSSIADALDFAVLTYNASNAKYVASGMIQEEYLNYINR